MNLGGKRVLVTGGAGFVGSSVCDELLEAGSEVYVVDTFVAGREALLPDGVSYDEIDVRSERLVDVVQEFEPHAIVHLAALHHIPYCNEHPEETFEVNVMGTRRVLQAARSASSLQRFVYASTAAVYPPCEGPNDERQQPGPIDVYGRTKLVGEDLVELFQGETGVPAVAARLFNVYGPDDTNDHLVPAVLDQVRNGDREIELGNLRPKRDFVHVADVARALLELLSEHEAGYRRYNVGTGTVYSVREVVDCVSEALGDEIRIVQEADRVRESDRPHLEADIGRIRREVGWEPTIEFVEGLRSVLDHEVSRREQEA